jgi:cyclophilin family peptidyl-prolyl cis-trans isomerase
MACLITKGRTEQCKDQVGGLKAIYIINYQIATADITYDNTNTDLITAITNVDTLYKYELKGADNTFDQDVVSDRNAGTTYFSQKLNIRLKHQDIATHKEIKLLAYARPHIVVETNNSQFFIMGLEQGADVVGGTISTGGEMKSASGYSLNFVADEKLPANFLNASTPAAMLALFTSATLVTS